MTAKEPTFDPLNLPVKAFLAWAVNNELPMQEVVVSFRRGYVRAALTATKGNRSRAARLLGIHRNTLLRDIQALGLVGVRFDGPVEQG
jgi:DNA-binding NtrC family response regulator